MYHGMRVKTEIKESIKTSKMGNVTLGGERLGSGKKMKQYLRDYERSNHDLGYVWRSSMASGTLVPFMSELMLPGDTFDIDLNTDVMTHPTVGPLFGSYKMQLDVFTIPMRLYQAQLHNNKLGIGLDMSKIKLPQLFVRCNGIDTESPTPIDIQQINPSSLMAYLGMRGAGQKSPTSALEYVTVTYNAVPYLAYYDIYKNYYANKQEEVGMFIDYEDRVEVIVNEMYVKDYNGNHGLPVILVSAVRLVVTGKNLNPDQIILFFEKETVIETRSITESAILESDVTEDGIQTITFGIMSAWYGWSLKEYSIPSNAVGNPEPQVKSFPLENLDKMRETILSRIMDPSAFTITGYDENAFAPYKNNLMPIFDDAKDGDSPMRSLLPMQGLALKTYQSDLFNNWLNTEYVDGTNGIAEVTGVDVSGGVLKLDTLNLAQKVYNMLNRIAVSGGTYYDWLEAVYSESGYGQAETPVYIGGLSKEIIFNPVISNSATEDQPLGSLGGRGQQSDKHKGGSMIAKVSEPSYVMGIISLTPRLDYSQGNKWDMLLKTMDDLHKPELDGIGFQDLITDQMASWSTIGDNTGAREYKSAGKTPAWINYMTNVNRTYGNFADERNEMFMTLNRRYEWETEEDGIIKMKDLTTYVDPAKYNYTFAQVDRSAQNFWVQIAVNIHARRKVSARQIPNL